MRIRSIASIANRLSDFLRLLIAGGVLVLALCLPAFAMNGGGGSGGGMGGGMGSHGDQGQTGSGMGQSGHMMDHGQDQQEHMRQMDEMHRGWADQYPQGSQVEPGQGELTRDQARSMVENYVRGTNNPNIQVGKIAERQGYFEVPITTREGSLVDTVRIDKRTGEFSSASGQ